MTEERLIRLVIGALLHDIGKAVYRAGEDSRRHAVSGKEFLSAENGAHLQDRDILDCVRYHHATDMREANLPRDSLAYVVYMADNIASAVDRREQDDLETGRGSFDKGVPLASIFNLLNGNRGKMHYSPRYTDMESFINFPAEEEETYTVHDYKQVLRNIAENLRGVEWTRQYLHSLLEVLEANLSFVPSSTNMQEVPDISLYDHMRLTAAFATCIEEYLAEDGEQDYRRRLFSEGKKFYSEKAFLLAVLDLSGIQKFIYTISTKKALKTLRARSFYLEFLMEHIADELLEQAGLTRANLIYSGGGHCHLLLPNTEKMRQAFTECIRRINAWCVDTFDISLYLTGAYVECSSETFHDVPAGSYEALHRDLSLALSEGKAHRYTADEILRLNDRKVEDDSRECKVCRQAGHVNEDGVCSLCEGMQELSSRIMGEHYAFFAAVSGDQHGGVPLPGGFVLVSGDEPAVRKWQSEQAGLRIYGKNRFYTGNSVSTRIWIGDYHTGETFEELAKHSDGIRRLGILRADVDNLGCAFAMGFQQPYRTLSRTSVLSRQLSMFFKLHIRKILAHPEFTLRGKKKECRHAAIVYSGGDDLFIVGAWDDVLELAIDIRRNFARYTEGTLTISAGFGIYPEGYPISAMANETADLEEKSKCLPEKDAVTLFENGENHAIPGVKQGISDGTYHWSELEDEVIGEKYSCVAEFFDSSEMHGKSFLYRLLELLRGHKEKINLSRYIYLLSRMEPDRKSDEEAKGRYRKFSAKMLQWIQNEKDVRQLKTAIQIYAYITRETRDENAVHQQ